MIVDRALCALFLFFFSTPHKHCLAKETQTIKNLNKKHLEKGEW